MLALSDPSLQRQVAEVLGRVCDHVLHAGTAQGTGWPAPAQQPQAVQVEDGVSDDARRPLLVPPGCHHQHGHPAAPGSPEHHLVPLHNALKRHHRERNK